MMGDALMEERGSEGTASVIPTLKPILVAADQDVDALIRTARANIARLSLELRVVLNDATAAESEGDNLGGATIGSDLIAAREFLRSALDSRIEERRRELASQVEEGRAEAARRIEAAQIEARALVDSARAELLAVLLKGTQPAPVTPVDLVTHVDPVTPASLRIVADQVFRADHPAGANHNGSIPTSGNDAAAGYEVEAPLVQDHDPLLPTEAVVTATSAPEQTSPAVPEPETQQDPDPVAASDGTREPGAVRTAEPLLTDLPDQLGPQVAKARQGGSYWAKFLYLDVALPLIAVLVVTIVLLAWLG